MKQVALQTSIHRAKKLIEETLEDYKKKGVKEIDNIDLHWKTQLPLSTISQVMNLLEKEGWVVESE